MADGPKEISPNASKISVLAPKSGGLEISPAQGSLELGIEKDAEFGEIGMGVLSDGTPYLKSLSSMACPTQSGRDGQWQEKVRQRFRDSAGLRCQVGAVRQP